MLLLIAIKVLCFCTILYWLCKKRLFYVKQSVEPQMWSEWLAVMSTVWSVIKRKYKMTQGWWSLNRTVYPNSVECWLRQSDINKALSSAFRLSELMQPAYRRIPSFPGATGTETVTHCHISSLLDFRSCCWMAERISAAALRTILHQRWLWHLHH